MEICTSQKSNAFPASNEEHLFIRPFLNAGQVLRLTLVVIAMTSTITAMAQESSDPAIQNSKQVEFFEAKIRPVLVKHCLECHSSQKDISGGLLLDSKSGWEKGGDSGPAIQAGQPDKSLLLKAMLYDDPHLRMPPDGKLPAPIIDDFKKWIAEGAADPRTDSPPLPSPSNKALSLENASQHWAYRPLNSPVEIPVGRGRSNSIIDNWIDNQLLEKNLQANPIASKRALIRRLTVDLHGVLPTPAEIENFERDDTNDAYEKLVDRLLASRRFAERMARHWLDVVRYGESLTLRGFTLPEAWRYRDYVIDAFNRDLPMDEFIVEQISGDLMTSDDLAVKTRRQIAATFWLLGNTNLEEQDKKQLEMDVVDEQLEVMGKAFLGQSIGCARCHDHKFDPIPTRDYYALAGILKSSIALEHENVSKWIETPLPLLAEEEAKFKKWEEELKQVKADIAKLDNGSKSSGKKISQESLPGIVVDDAQAKKIGVWTASTSVQEYVADGYLHDGNSDRGAKTVTFEPPALPQGRYEVRLSYAHGDNRSSKTLVSVFSADGEAIKTIDQKVTGPIDGMWVSLGEYRFEKDGQAFVIVSNEGADGHVIADAVQFLPLDGVTTADKNTNSNTPLPSPAPAKDPLSDQDREALKKSLKSKQEELEKELLKRPRVMAMKPAPKPEDLSIHIRGSVHQLGEKVPRGVLRLAQASMPSESFSPEKPPTRLELANWIASSHNPLTARVMVNRFWYWTMGEGLVRTVDQFGTTGEPPVHGDLLDHLAIQFIDQGWSAKTLVKKIVLSSAYQYGSGVETNPAQEIDPENRNLWRSHRKRLDAESIRDSMLVISGELRDCSGGRSFARELASDYDYRNDEPIRSIYLPSFRNSMPELLRVFDVADSSVSIGKRNQTTVASQALLMTNDPWVRQRCDRLRIKLMAESKDPAKFVERASTAIWGRLPTTEETKRFREFLGNKTEFNDSDSDRITDLLQAMFASIDFRYVE